MSLTNAKAISSFKRFKRAVRLGLYLTEAFIELCLARLTVWFIPFKVFKRGLGKHMHLSAEQHYKSEQAVAKKLSWAIQTVARYTPFKSNCMVQALAAKRMFRKRKFATTLYIGVGKDQGNNKLNHAWLRSGPIIVTGNLRDLDSYAIIGTYAEE